MRSEPHRPQFHFTAQRHWINDPNGLIWWDGEYHLFFQFNPFGNDWGHMSWGHAVSTNLIDWEELPVAIPEDARAMAFSGSVVLDAHNTSGFHPDGGPVLVACYTACLHAPGIGQVQDLAYSLDRGRTWTRYAANPVLDEGLKDFRDPKVFWHEPSGQWVMAVVVPDAREVRFYGSPNLRQWLELSRFDAPFEGQGIWECPDLIELPVDGGGTVWMLKVDAFGGHPSGETGARVFFGQFDGTRFVPVPEAAPQWIDGGSDFYAALSWANVPSTAFGGDPVWLAWMSCHRYAKFTPTHGFRGAMSLPRTLRAQRTPNGWALRQQVVPGFEALRQHPHQSMHRTVSAGHPCTLWTSLPDEAGPQAELLLQLEALDPGAILTIELQGLAMDGSPRSTTRIALHGATATLTVDRSRSGLIPNDDAAYAGTRSLPCRLPAPGAPLDLRVWWDRGSVEVLADTGLRCLTEQVFPVGRQWQIQIHVEGGSARWAEATVWPLKPALFTDRRCADLALTGESG